MQLFKIYTKINLLLPISQRFVHTYIYKMNKAYMRCPEGSEAFEISFQYFCPQLNVNRQFNFSRKLSENVGAFLSRVATNVDKAISKKQKKKKNNDEISDDSNISKQIHLYQDGNEVDEDVLCKDLFNMGGKIQLKVVDQEFDVVINTPWIKNIALPTSMLATFPIYPSKFETLFVDKKLSKFTWYKSLDKVQWEVTGTGFLYIPTKDEVNHYLKLCCCPKNLHDVGPDTEVVSTGKVEADPGQCPFDIRHKFTREKLSGKNFRVVTYNLLADIYCDSDYSRTVLFPYCPPYALNIDYRKQLILKELTGYNADIICLQEVDEKVFENDLEPVFLTYGIKGIFNKKANTREGVASFYNSSRFRFLQSTSQVLGDDLDNNPLFTDLWNKISANKSLIARLTDRGTTLQLTVFESIENNEILLIANTHLYFHPDADHIRLLQAAISSIYIEDFLSKLASQGNKRVSLIFCGDFNSVPECGIYKLFTTGHVPEDFIDWKSNAEEAVTGLNLNQKRLLSSACGTPKYTNFTVGFRDCLDYIYYERSNFEVTQVIPLPSEDELIAHTAIPSVLLPSDHISLVADLKWL